MFQLGTLRGGSASRGQAWFLTPWDLPPSPPLQGRGLREILMSYRGKIFCDKWSQAQGGCGGVVGSPSMETHKALGRVLGPFQPQPRSDSVTKPHKCRCCCPRWSGLAEACSPPSSSHFSLNSSKAFVGPSVRRPPALV